MSDIQPASLPLYAGWVVPGATAAEQRAYIERLICQRSGDVVVAWLASEVERLRDALRALLADEDGGDPIVESSGDESCFFCGALKKWRSECVHTPECAWVAAKALLLAEGKL